MEGWTSMGLKQSSRCPPLPVFTLPAIHSPSPRHLILTHKQHHHWPCAQPRTLEAISHFLFLSPLATCWEGPLGEEQFGLWNLMVSVQILPLPLTSCVVLRK